MNEDKDTGRTEETTDAAAVTDAAAGAGAGNASAADQAATQDPQKEADAAAAETAVKADTTDGKQVTTEETDKPGEEKKEPAKDGKKEDPKPDPVEELTAKLGKTERLLRESKAKTAALMLGVRSERVKAAVQLAEITGLDLMAEDADTQFEAALQAVVDSLPELAAAPAGTGSPGAFARKKEPTKTPFEEGLES